MKKFWRSFKEFAIKGNVVDLVAGVVIATSLSAIAISLVNDIILPLFGLLIGGVNFAELVIVLAPATETSTAITINYGLFIQKILNFFVIAFIVFLVVKAIKRFQKANEALKKKLLNKNQDNISDIDINIKAEPDTNDETQL